MKADFRFHYGMIDMIISVIMIVVYHSRDEYNIDMMNI